jgi:hypothetical protein
MKKKVNIVIDALINSIRNVVSGETFDTVVIKVSKSDTKYLKKGWAFDWIEESKSNKIYKLTTKDNPNVIQGLVSLEEINDNVRVHLIENAQFNIGKNKVYEGVAGNLFAFACKLSFDKGHEGNISFIAKSNLISHYEKTIKAKRIGNTNLMVLETDKAKILVEKYLKEFKWDL